MKEFTVTRDGDRDLRFTGEKVASVSGRANSGPDSNRWSEIRIYLTAAGAYVAQRVQRTLWEGEEDTADAAVCETPRSVRGFLTYDDVLSDLAKEALTEAGLDAETVEVLDGPNAPTEDAE